MDKKRNDLSIANGFGMAVSTGEPRYVDRPGKERAKMRVSHREEGEMDHHSIRLFPFKRPRLHQTWTAGEKRKRLRVHMRHFG